MTSAQVVETSVTNNSSFQNYPHSDHHSIVFFYVLLMLLGSNHLQIIAVVLVTSVSIAVAPETFYHRLYLSVTFCTIFLLIICVTFREAFA